MGMASEASRLVKSKKVKCTAQPSRPGSILPVIISLIISNRFRLIKVMGKL
jgi:hypothetical protein